MRRADGRSVWVTLTVRLIKDGDGKLIERRAIVTDITERKRTEERLQESQHFIQRITDSIPAILYVYDLIEQKNIYTNKGITMMRP